MTELIAPGAGANNNKSSKRTDNGTSSNSKRLTSSTNNRQRAAKSLLVSSQLSTTTNEPATTLDSPSSSSLTVTAGTNDSSSSSSSSSQVVVVLATRDVMVADQLVPQTETVAYKNPNVIGNGSFGVVYCARMVMPVERLVAIKKVLQDKHFKNREVEIMRKVQHTNIVQLLYYFYSSGANEKKRSGTNSGEVYLNLVLEFIPETAYRISRFYTRSRETVPQIFVKLYVYQLLRALGYLHRLNICHRDIKPQNLLIYPETSILKLCDFGSAKILSTDSVNVSYICSRYYRAPELIFGAVKYTCSIDTWSTGCVFAELLLGRPAFPGDCGVNQLVEIIKVLGTPTTDQIKQMNPHYECFKFPQIKPSTWSNVFPSKTPSQAIDLVSKLLEYIPARRIKPLHALTHTYFDELRLPSTKLPNGKSLPELFDFNDLELTEFNEVEQREDERNKLIALLMPKHCDESEVKSIVSDNNNSNNNNNSNSNDHNQSKIATGDGDSYTTFDEQAAKNNSQLPYHSR